MLEEIIEDLDVVYKSPQAFYLLKWASERLDFTKVSAQQDLTRWLYNVVREESSKLGVSQREYTKRFKGMIKFFTDPKLGLSAIKEIQDEVAQMMVSDIQEELRAAEDLDDIQRIYIRYKGKSVPPLADTQYHQAFEAELRRAKYLIAQVVRHPDYKYILNVLREAKQMVDTGQYKEASLVRLRSIVARLRIASEISKDIQRALGLPFSVNQKSIKHYIRLFEREIESRPIRPRRPIRRRIRRRVGVV